MKVVGEAEDGGNAISKIAALRPDVVLLETRIPVGRRQRQWDLRNGYRMAII
jgi:chemotaxis response regulator CheB